MWKLKTFGMDDDSNIVNYQYVFRVEGVIVLTKHFPAFAHEEDHIVVDEAKYTRDTPVCEELARKWIAGQNQYLKTFDNVNEYLDYIKTVLALEE